MIKKGDWVEFKLFKAPNAGATLSGKVQHAALGLGDVWIVDTPDGEYTFPAGYENDKYSKSYRYSC